MLILLVLSAGAGWPVGPAAGSVTVGKTALICTAPGASAARIAPLRYATSARSTANAEAVTKTKMAAVSPCAPGVCAEAYTPAPPNHKHHNHLLTWRGRGYRVILQPATRGTSSCFCFTLSSFHVGHLYFTVNDQNHLLFK